MLPSQVCLLHFPSAAPRSSFCSRSICDSVIVKHFVLGRNEKTAGTNDAVRGDTNSVVHSCARRYCVETSNRWGFDAFDEDKGKLGVIVKVKRDLCARQPISKRLSSPIRMTSFLLKSWARNPRDITSIGHTHLFTMIAPSSIIQPLPITIGPAMANIVAFGCTIVPKHCE